MDSYRVEKQAALQLLIPDEDAEIDPVPTSGGGRKPEPELDVLSNILKAFNDQFGNIPWSDTDRVHRMITEEIPAKVAADTAYQNAQKQGDKSKARIEHDAALLRVMTIDVLHGLTEDEVETYRAHQPGRTPPQLPKPNDLAPEPVRTKLERSTLQVRRKTWTRRPQLRANGEGCSAIIHVLVVYDSFDYMTKQRGLSTAILASLIDQGKLYADARGNAVFVMLAGKPRRRTARRRPACLGRPGAGDQQKRRLLLDRRSRLTAHRALRICD